MKPRFSSVPRSGEETVRVAAELDWLLRDVIRGGRLRARHVLEIQRLTALLLEQHLARPETASRSEGDQ